MPSHDHALRSKNFYFQARLSWGWPGGRRLHQHPEPLCKVVIVVILFGIVVVVVIVIVVVAIVWHHVNISQPGRQVYPSREGDTVDRQTTLIYWMISSFGGLPPFTGATSTDWPHHWSL